MLGRSDVNTEMQDWLWRDGDAAFAKISANPDEGDLPAAVLLSSSFSEFPTVIIVATQTGFESGDRIQENAISSPGTVWLSGSGLLNTVFIIGFGVIVILLLRKANSNQARVPRQKGSRRVNPPAEFPLIDSCGVFLTRDRRRLPDRRLATSA